MSLIFYKTPKLQSIYLSENSRPLIPRSRIESLSDLIFGLALSIGAIALIGSSPSSVGAVVSDLEIFGFSFYILIRLWLTYTRIMSVLPIETKRVATLNLLMLFLVAIEPYLLNLFKFGATPTACSDLISLGSFLASSGCVDFFASTLYAVDLGLLFIVMGVFDHIVAREEKKLVSLEEIKKFRRSGNLEIFFGAIFLLSALPQFGTTAVAFLGGTVALRYALWLIPAFVAPVVRSAYRLRR